MPLTDLPLDELRTHRPDVAEPDDFDAFWSETLRRSRTAARPAERVAISTPFTVVDVEDLTYSGYDGDAIRAWVTRPRGAAGPLPAVVEFTGYGSGRGLPGERLHWAAAGYVHVLMDTRGQGGLWGPGGDTPDRQGAGRQSEHLVVRGVDSPETYYYRRVFVDAVRLVDTVREFDGVDPDRVAVAGVSQGGGIALAAAALAPEVCGVLADLPFLAHMRRGAEVALEGPFAEIARLLSIRVDDVDTVFRTLSYFDAVAMSRRVSAPALFSVALMDTVVPPSTVFAAYHHCGATVSRIDVLPFTGHEGSPMLRWPQHVEWLRRNS